MVVSENNPFVISFTAEEFFKMKIGQKFASSVPSYVVEDALEDPKYVFKVDFKHQVVEMGYEDDSWVINT